jgi:xylulokinase
MALYLGLDLSTQSLTAIVIEAGGRGAKRVLFEHSLRFDHDFPQYKTHNGVLPRDDPLVARSSPLLWAEALDRMMEVVAKESGVDAREIKAIAGSGQQHGSVYLNDAATERLARLSPHRPIVEQLGGIFSRDAAPIWMDSSTSSQCQAITQAVGGEGVLAVLTGSRAFERFTGPQIRKFCEEDPEGYERTDKIHLVSSFMATLLAGKHAPIDHGDGAGMNLMDLARKRWAPMALQATAPDLGRRLPDLAESWTLTGTLAPYWVKRHAYDAKAKVVAWSGDNPCSLIGVGLVKPGRVAISLGTSDTLFGFMSTPRVDPTGASHVFGSPTGDYMSLICFKNGSLARERIRNQYGYDWLGFSKALRETPPGNRGGIILPWFEPEITPAVYEAGVRRYALDAKDGQANMRAVVEAQMLSSWVHSRWMGVEIDTVHATGGAARNRDILRVMADVHNARVYQFPVGNSACLGAALRAYHADEVSRGRAIPWEEVVAGFAEPVRESELAPIPENVEMYKELKKVYSACEDHALRSGEDPTPLIQAFCRMYGDKGPVH